MTKNKESGSTRSDGVALERIKASLSGQPPWPRRFARLAHAIREAQRKRAPRVKHEDVQALLDVVVGDQLGSVGVADRYPDVWAHLQTCTVCRGEYESLYALLRRERAGELTPLPEPIPPTRFPFLEPSPATSPAPGESDEAPKICPWTWHIARWPGHINADLVFARSYLVSLFRPPALAPTWRSDEQRLGPCLIYSAIVDELDGALLEVTAYPEAGRPGSFEIHVLLVGPGGPIGLTAISLAWAGRVFYGTTDAQGRAMFSSVPTPVEQLAACEPEPNYAIRLQIGQVEP